MSTPATLFLVFNRPETTARVFDAIRLARPARLYVAADGPRADRPAEVERCAEVRHIATQVDWPCELRTLFRDSNLGCREALSSAITWFFDHEPEGIILEDDCLPHPSFFRYCAELLEKYRDDSSVMVIGGDKTFSAEFPLECDYVFSKYALIWGWASWARAWKVYDFDGFISDNRRTVLNSVLDRREVREHWLRSLQSVADGELNTWDYPWCYSIMKTRGLCIVPKNNLISNIGFSQDATHTVSTDNPRASSPTHGLAMPLRHPQRILLQSVERAIERDIHGIAPRSPLPVRALLRVAHLARRLFG